MFVLSIRHYVSSLDGLKTLFISHLGFNLVTSDASTIVVENGSMSLTLVLTTKANHSTLNLEIACSALKESLLDLSKKGYQQLSAINWASQNRQEAQLQTIENICLCLYQEYSEDELDIYPTLPSKMSWDKEATLSMQKLLRSVPIAFRDNARLKSTEQAECNAITYGRLKVNLDDVIKALITVMPDFGHDKLKSAMQDNNIPISDWFDLPKP